MAFNMGVAAYNVFEVVISLLTSAHYKLEVGWNSHGISTILLSVKMVWPCKTLIVFLFLTLLHREGTIRVENEIALTTHGNQGDQQLWLFSPLTKNKALR